LIGKDNDLNMQDIQSVLKYIFPADGPKRKNITSMFRNECHLLCQMSSKISGGNIVEIGRKMGGSLLLLSASSDNCHIFSVDIRDKHLNEARDLCDQFIPRDKYSLITSSSVLFGQEWKNGPIDLIFIDGDHSYGAVLEDLQTWIPHVKSGGIVLMHDYFFPRPKKQRSRSAKRNFKYKLGVHKAMSRYMENHLVEFIVCKKRLAAFKKM